MNESLIPRIFSFFMLLLFTPLLINALNQQITTYISGEANSFYNIIVLAIALFTLLAAYIRKKTFFRLDLFIISFLYSLYTISLLSYYSNNFSFKYVVGGYLSSIIIYLFMAFSFLPGIINSRQAIKYIIFLLFITSTLGITQYLSNDAIVNISDTSGSFKISSYIFIDAIPNRVRGFSLFTSGLEFGYFLIFSVGILIYLIINRSKKYSFILSIAIIAIFCTLTRNIYIGALLCIIISLIYNIRNLRKDILYAIPLVVFFLALVMSYSSINSSGLASSKTLELRREFWQQEVLRQSKVDTFSFIFGRGIYQNGDPGSGYLFVDNTYLQLIAQFGILGLILFLSFYLVMLRISIRHRESPVSSGLYGFLAVWPFLAMFNICVFPLVLFSALSVLTIPYNDRGIDRNER